MRRRRRQVFSDQTLASFAVPIEPDPEAADDLDTERQEAERRALVESLRARVGEIEAKHHLGDGIPE
jgi:hypothetical protein